jgi:hypothetical protein
LFCPKIIILFKIFREQNELKIKETYEKNLQKQLMQQKLQKQQSQLQKARTNERTFEMLQTDDSTDDESDAKKKRPPLPDWSQSNIFTLKIFNIPT